MTPAVAPAGSVHRAYVAVVNNRGVFDPPYVTDAQLRGLVDEALDFWVDESHGGVSSFEIAGYVRFNATKAGCSLDDMYADGNAQFPAINTTPTVNHLVVLAPSGCNFGAQGFGSVGVGWGSSGQTITSVSIAARHVLAHELGHNLGFAHSNVLKCTGAPPQTCQAPFEYEDPYNVMNNNNTDFGYQALTSALLNLNGGLVTGQQEEIALGPLQTTETVSDTLQPSTEAGGLRSLMVTDPVDGHVYYVEYRAGLGRDADSFYADADLPQANFPDRVEPTNGVTVLRCSGRTTELVPQPDGDHWRGAFAAGETFTSPSGAITVEVTDLNGADGADVTVSLAGPAPTTPAPFVSPVPTISGAVQVGQQVGAFSTLDGDWQRSYRWTANGVTIPDSGTSVLTVSPAMLGKSLQVELTGHQCGHETTVAMSAAKSVAPGAFTAAAPKITGTAKVGKKLKVVPGTWSPSATLTYQWFVKGKRVKGATGKKLKLTKRMKGKKVTVTVTGTKTAYTTLTRTSKPTGKVKG